MNALRITVSAFALLILCSELALADAISLGAAYSCNPLDKRFTVMADVDADDKRAGVFEPNAEKSIKRLDAGDHKLICKLGTTTIAVDIRVLEAANGMCQGAGGAVLSAPVVNGVKLPLTGIDPGYGGNYELHDGHDCFGGKALIKVIVEPDALTVCTGSSWQWKIGWSDVTCKSQKLRANKSLEHTREQ